MLRIVPQRPLNLSGHFYMDLRNQPDSLHPIFPPPGRSVGNTPGTSKFVINGRGQPGCQGLSYYRTRG